MVRLTTSRGLLPVTALCTGALCCRTAYSWLYHSRRVAVTFTASQSSARYYTCTCSSCEPLSSEIRRMRIRAKQPCRKCILSIGRSVHIRKHGYRTLEASGYGAVLLVCVSRPSGGMLPPRPHRDLTSLTLRSCTPRQYLCCTFPMSCPLDSSALQQPQTLLLPYFRPVNRRPPSSLERGMTEARSHHAHSTTRLQSLDTGLTRFAALQLETRVAIQAQGLGIFQTSLARSLIYICPIATASSCFDFHAPPTPSLLRYCSCMFSFKLRQYEIANAAPLWTCFRVRDNASIVGYGPAVTMLINSVTLSARPRTSMCSASATQ